MSVNSRPSTVGHPVESGSELSSQLPKKSSGKSSVSSVNGTIGNSCTHVEVFPATSVASHVTWKNPPAHVSKLSSMFVISSVVPPQLSTGTGCNSIGISPFRNSSIRRHDISQLSPSFPTGHAQTNSGGSLSSTVRNPQQLWPLHMLTTDTVNVCPTCINVSVAFGTVSPFISIT